jgi:hypothetical protein
MASESDNLRTHGATNLRVRNMVIVNDSYSFLDGFQRSGCRGVASGTFKGGPSRRRVFASK